MFPCEFCEIFKNTFLQKTSGRLPLSFECCRCFNAKLNELQRWMISLVFKKMRLKVYLRSCQTSMIELLLEKICDALSNLVPFVQFKKREKHPWRSVNFSTCNFAKINTPPWVFFLFFKLYKCYQITQRITHANKGSKYATGVCLFILE